MAVAAAASSSSSSSGVSMEGHSSSTVPPPSAFYCPISLDIMMDPVTLSSGITYDRASIQSWLAAGNHTCPVTRQALAVHDPFQMVPNHTLQRIIQAWCHSHSTQLHLLPDVDDERAGAVQEISGHTRIGRLCAKALLKLGLVRHTGDGPLFIPHEQAASFLTSLLAHHSIAACQDHPPSLHTCQEAIATLCSQLPLNNNSLPPLSSLSHSHVLHCLLHFLHNSCSSSRSHAAHLLSHLISHHPSPKTFLRSLPPHSLSSIAHGLALFLKLHTPSTPLAQSIPHTLSLLCKSSRNVLLSFTEASFSAMAHAALDQLLHSARQGSCSSENALSLLENLASCAEGRAAIASHAFAVPTIAKHLQRSASRDAMESTVVVLWKLCRYSSVERVRRQSMACCVPSKLVLLLQASHCSSRTKAKAGALVKLLLEEAKGSRH